MPSTDLDSAPLLVIRADDAANLLRALRGGGHWAIARRASAVFQAKLARFCEDRKWSNGSEIKK